MDEFGNTVTTRLLTLLNVSATKVGKRRRPETEPVEPPKQTKRRSISFATKDIIFNKGDPPPQHLKKPIPSKPKEDAITVAETEGDAMEVVDEDENTNNNLYEEYFGINPKRVSDPARSAVESRTWTSSSTIAGKLGPAVVSIPEGAEQANSSVDIQDDILDNLKTPFKARQQKESSKQAEFQDSFISTLATRKDLYVTSLPLEKKRSAREAIALHAINHVTKKRRRVLKNNERLTKVSKTNPDAPSPEDVQDQGFTRPSVLILLPFRSSAVDWFRAITSHTPSPSFQIENQSRFLSEYGLPAGVVDKLVAADAGTYPADHVENFKGNVDDNFRIGIKFTRKTIKMFADFYGCDIILASPLGLRRSIEKEKNGDYLSSVELLVIDQMDALTMQNWEHVKFVMAHVNQLPKASHDTDFSRIKPWYLEGFAKYLRQSVFLTPYETPDTRSLYNSLTNVSGKIRTEKRWTPVNVPSGVEPRFINFEVNNPMDDPEKRFNHFTSQLLPSILKSAVQSTNTILFIPSSFDFIRVENHFRKSALVSYSVLSEYSSNQEISRARLSFFKGEKQFLLISERFHFYKRYKIRGCRNIIFYGPPDHPQFFTELLSFPFLEDDVDASDVSCSVLYSKFDRFRLERVLGSEAAIEMLKS